MVHKLKYNIFVFFAKIRMKQTIKKIEQNLQGYSWCIGVEKNDDPVIWQRFKDERVKLFIAETALSGLQYDNLFLKEEQ